MTRKLAFVVLTVSTALGLAAPATAATISDPVNDFIPTYTGPLQTDLDVTSFSVSFVSSTNSFLLQSTFAGDIDPSLGGFYAIGVNTGTGPLNFASIGLPGVKFNQVISVQKAGTATIGGNPLPAGAVTIGGNALSVLVPLSLLPSTGFDALHYGFNIWPRSATTPGTAVISDFAPDNGVLSVAAPVPEPASWALMISGLGITGWSLRRRAGTPLPQAV